MDDLAAGPVGVDTSPFIYLIEEDQRYLPIVESLFARADKGDLDLVTSVLTLMEVLVVPFRAGNRLLAGQYEALLTRGRGVKLVELTRTLLASAAQLRAATGIRTPDALQMVAAIEAGCRTFLTNDRRLPDVAGLRVLQLRDYIGGR